MKKVLMAATAVAFLFGGAAYAQPGPPPSRPDSGGYTNPDDPNGYYDNDDQYYRYNDNRGDRDRRDWRDRYDDDEYDAGPPPPPSSYYREGYYEDNCRRGNTAAGTIFGALAGGLIGNAAGHGDGGAVVGGAILGGLLGNVVARDIPCEDHPYAFRAYARGLDGDLGHRYSWRHGRNYGYFTPRREFHRGGYRCRSWSETTYVRGRTISRSGTACRRPDGRWHFDD